MSATAKRTYETIATIAQALPETKREEFATLLDDLQRTTIGPEAIRLVAIRRWLADAGWQLSR